MSDENQVGARDAPDLTDALVAPGWLRDLGATAWLLVGVLLFLVGAVWILSLTHTIVLPVLAAGVIAAVAPDWSRGLRFTGFPAAWVPRCCCSDLWRSAWGSS